MIYLCLLIWACINLSYAQQYYDSSECSSDTSSPGSRYTCNSLHDSCHTFLVYRANRYFKTLSNISGLFDMSPDKSGELLHLNNLTSPSEILKPGREVLVPIVCSCSGQFFQANFSYVIPGSTTYSEIACGVFEGLVKSLTLAQENQSQENSTFQVGSKLNVPLKCACPDSVSISKGVRYLVTYPFVEGDDPVLLGQKFGISLEDLWEANLLESKPTVYPNTTFLVPLESNSFINFNIPDSPPPAPGFLPTITIENTNKSKLRNLYIVASVVGFCLVLVAILACGLYLKALKTWKGERLQSFNRISTPISCNSTIRSSPPSGRTGRSSTNSCLSPDLLIGIKYSLISYSIEELKKATKNFGEETKIGDQDYKAKIDGVEVLIKQMRFEDTRHVIDVHSRLNHKNIVSLHGVCYGENDFSWSYLVFEYPINGCLRDCLSSSSNSLCWLNRTQIAFDIATGLHYLHYCIFPTYAHLNINSRHIYLTSTWRAKLANIGTNPVGGSLNNTPGSTIKGWLAPEYLVHGSASEKVDIFAFGVVLLELISARETLFIEDQQLYSFKDSIGFLGGGSTASEGGCFEQLRSFMDPSLKEDYSLADALCLAVLAKACVEDDPLHRPSMDDILKVLARMV